MSDLKKLSHRERQAKFEEIFRSVGPHIDTQPAKLVMIQLMISLRMEGLIGKELTEKEMKMLRVIHDSVMLNHEKRHDALKLAQRLLK